MGEVKMLIQKFRSLEEKLSRFPQKTESPFQFFVGFKPEGTPFLLLPTPTGILPRGEVFAVQIIQKRSGALLFRMADDIIAVQLNEFVEIHDDLTYFFGPNHNMLKKYVESEDYLKYVDYVHKAQSTINKKTWLIAKS